MCCSIEYFRADLIMQSIKFSIIVLSQGVILLLLYTDVYQNFERIDFTFILNFLAVKQVNPETG